MIIGKGTFNPGPGRHVEGSFTITQSRDGVLIETCDDFSFDGSPEANWTLYLGVPNDPQDPDGLADALSKRLDGLPSWTVPVRGKQSGMLPADVNIDEHKTIYLWYFSPDNSVILGTGAIERTYH